MAYEGEELGEAACFGDLEILQELLEKGVDVNFKNKVNGWTALHWATYRNNLEVVKILLNYGADKDCLTNRGDLPSSLTDNKEILALLEQQGSTNNIKKLPITPNYLKSLPVSLLKRKSNLNNTNQTLALEEEEELVLKVKTLNNSDFIEIELPKSQLTFEKLKEVCSKELNLSPNCYINLIRKLPNTKLRKDKDVQRLKDFQELEVEFIYNY